MLTDELKDYLAGIKRTGAYRDDFSIRAHLSGTGWNIDEIENAVAFMKTLPDPSAEEQTYNGKTKKDLLMSLPTGEVEFTPSHHDSYGVRFVKIVGSLAFIPAIIFVIYAFVMPALDGREVYQQAMVSNWNDAAAGRFIPKAHAVKGLATVYYYDDKKILELADFETTYGMNLRVYLAQTEEGAGAVDLGSLPGIKGQMYFDIPEKVDHDKYRYVIIWDPTFKTNYGVAEIE